MLNVIWAVIMIISVVCGIITGRISEVSYAAINGGKAAVELCISLLGSICFWSGIMKITEKCGLTALIGKLCRPLIALLFPGLKANSSAASAITMNISANLLGLGDAATPLGIEAMKCLQEINNDKSTVSNYMVTFIVMNTASIQLLPTTIAAIRAEHGAASPMDILPAVLLSSACSLIVGLLAAAIGNIRYIRKHCHGALKQPI
ncbi:MAG TPA: spore maturation protein A [Firmicutes bacterium]|nr:spore maturation protein A [Bacillota bacterium]